MRSCITVSLRRRKVGDGIGKEIKPDVKETCGMRESMRRYCMLYASYVWEGIKDEEKV